MRLDDILFSAVATGLIFGTCCAATKIAPRSVRAVAPQVAAPVHSCEMCRNCCTRCNVEDKCCCAHWDKCGCPPKDDPTRGRR